MSCGLKGVSRARLDGVQVHTADESECNDSNCLNKAIPEKEGSSKVSPEIFWYPGALRNNREKNHLYIVSVRSRRGIYDATYSHAY